ncbi:Hypothetical_protein [Hexamita inflata]|uniref:Hypothetical_protein n=1 Tax=Hexamita inflata TaxID=28002 RepID=A0AA86RFH1_9EUKA|nr:Hypothetical protein HINF_LOCUS65209 [Hexamita inflata]
MITSPRNYGDQHCLSGNVENRWNFLVKRGLNYITDMLLIQLQSQELMKFGDSDSCNQKQILVVVLQIEESLTWRSKRVVNDKNLYCLLSAMSCDSLNVTQFQL